MPFILKSFVCAALLATSACARQPAPPPKQQQHPMMWETLGTWSGRGNAQTESFPSASGALRIVWETTNETAPGTGTFTLTVNSAISGRVIREAVDQRGVGHGTVSVNDEPRQYHAVVESSNVDWKFSVDEGTPATVEDTPAK